MSMIDTKKIITKSSSEAEIPDSQLCTVYRCGPVIEVVSVKKRNRNPPKVRRLPNNQYMDLSTGEVKECQQHTRAHSDSLRKSFVTLRRLISKNFQGSINELMLVLTYSVLMTDTTQLYKDFKTFFAKLQYHYGPLSYISVIEPQQSGSWHFHVLVKKKEFGLLYIPKEHLDKLWGHGFTYVQRIKEVDNVGAYLTSYFKNIDMLEETTASENGKNKMIIKNARLQFYPHGVRIYRCSKDIKRVSPITLPYSKVKEIVGDMKPVRQSVKSIVAIQEDGTEKELNTIQYRQYNFKRKR